MYYIFYNNIYLIFVNVLLILDDQTCKLFYNQNYKYCSSPFLYDKIMNLIAVFFQFLVVIFILFLMLKLNKLIIKNCVV